MSTRKMGGQSWRALTRHLVLVAVVACCLQVLPVTFAAADNVTFIESVFPDQAAWEDVFVVAYEHPNCELARTTLSRANLLSAVADFPDFCGSADEETNQQELAAFLANVSVETNGAGANQFNGGLCYDREVACSGYYPPADGCSSSALCMSYCNDLSEPYRSYPECPCGYFGRGALQITNPYNYQETGDALHAADPTKYPDADFLKNDPSQLLAGDTAWWASLNFWMNHEGGLEKSATSVNGKMTCHRAITVYDDFGKTVEVINGNLECEGTPEQGYREKTAKRINYYKSYCGAALESPAVNGPALYDPAVTPTTQVDCAGGGGGGSDPTSRCGTDWSDANTHCRSCCTTDADCPAEYPKCYAPVANPSSIDGECSCSGDTEMSLSTFTVRPSAAGRAVVEWKTRMEEDVDGFFLHRSDTEDGTFVQITSSMIPAKGDDILGGSYIYRDKDTEGPVVFTMWYKLEAVDGEGESTWYGPVSAPAQPEWFWSAQNAEAGTHGSSKRSLKLNVLLSCLIVPVLLGICARICASRRRKA